MADARDIVDEFRTEVITATDGDPAVRLLDDEQLIARLAYEVELLRGVVVFADGFVVSQRGDMVLADLYNETCEPAGAIRRAGCHSRGRFRQAVIWP